MSQSDEKLIRSAKKGNQNALSQLYEEYVDRIYRYIVYRVPDDVAEDLTSEVFVRMVEALPGYKITGAPFEAWLYRIAAARVADYHRANHRHPETDLPENLYNDANPEKSMIAHQEVNRLRTAIQMLDNEQQTVLVLRFVELKTHQEVAAIVGKSVSAVKSIQHRALKSLTQLLGSDEKVRHYLRGIHD